MTTEAQTQINFSAADYDKTTAIARYSERLAELREAAEEEYIERSEVSERDFRAFVTDNPGWRKAALGLMDNGNLRAVWKGDDGSHLGLQFLGNQFGEYVIFKSVPQPPRSPARPALTPWTE